nr:hypothetical protein [Ensifer sp. PDNC004]
MEMKQAVAIFLESPATGRKQQRERKVEEGPGAHREVQAGFPGLQRAEDAERSEIFREQFLVPPFGLLLRTAQDFPTETSGPDFLTLAASYEVDFDRNVRARAGKAEQKGYKARSYRGAALDDRAPAKGGMPLWPAMQGADRCGHVVPPPA